MKWRKFSQLWSYKTPILFLYLKIFFCFLIYLLCYLPLSCFFFKSSINQIDIFSILSFWNLIKVKYCIIISIWYKFLVINLNIQKSVFISWGVSMLIIRLALVEVPNTNYSVHVTLFIIFITQYKDKKCQNCWFSCCFRQSQLNIPQLPLSPILLFLNFC